MFSQSNPANNVPIANYPFLYMTGLALSNDATTPNTILDIAAGQCRDSTDVYDMTLSTAITISTAVKGAGGLDTGTIAASKVYAVVLISDPISGNPTSAMFTLSPTSPTMPFGYSAYRVIGYVTIDSSSHILKGYWTSGNSSVRSFIYDAPQATAVTAGAATSYTAVDLSTLVPGGYAQLPVSIAYSYVPATAGNALSLQGVNSTGVAALITGQVATVHISGNTTVNAQLNASSSNKAEINYKVGNASDAVALNVAGYTTSL